MGSMKRLLPSLAEPLLYKDSAQVEEDDELRISSEFDDRKHLTGNPSGDEWRAGIRIPASMAESLRPLKVVNGAGGGQLESYLSTEESVSQDDITNDVKGRIVAVFTVSFDNHVGNTLEWCQSLWDSERTQDSRSLKPLCPTPESFSPHGLEFRALPAGIHNMEEDCLYFRHGALFGIAAFHRLMLPTSESARKERHARMRSVGALASSLLPLAHCLPLLRSEAARQCSTRARPNSPVLLRLLSVDSPPPPFQAGPPTPASASTFPLPPPDIFGEFVNEFGVFGITLWKALLLQCRVLFFSPPPVSFSCDLVLSTCALVHGISSPSSNGSSNSNHSTGSQRGSAPSVLPLFSIGLNDADLMSSFSSYVACTSEAILKHKRKLWDVLVEAKDGKWDFTVPSPELREELRLTPSDRARFRYLCGLKQKTRSTVWCTPTLEQFPCSCCPPSQHVYASALGMEQQLERVAAMNSSFWRAISFANADVMTSSEGLTELLHSAQMGRADVRFLQALLRLRA